MAKKFSKPELSRKINGDLPFENKKQEKEEDGKTRLDILLANEYPIYSRASIQKYIKAGYASVNGEVQTTPSLLIDEENDELTLNLPDNDKQFDPEIIFENENVIVFNKPRGMLSIVKNAGSREQSIEDYGEIVHRLDRDTSGVIIVAKNAETKGYLQKQFQLRKTHKTYYAVICGHPNPEHAMIDIPLTRNLKRPTTFMVSPTGREAQTEYKVIAKNSKYSLVELKPRTGRTHQLRIHMAHIGTPILGDPVYNPKEQKTDRMYLHATSLEITVPNNGKNERMTFTAELPEEFRSAVK